ncbi:MAG: 7TM diverse intracellular signaling domain-containing protein [Ferruginibacter sp.]
MKGLFIFILLVVANKIHAQVLLDGKQMYSFDDNIFILKETKQAISITQAWNEYNDKKFNLIQSTNSAVNFGFVKNVYWFAIPLKNITARQLQLEAGIDNGGIFEIEFYLLSAGNGNLVSQFHTGSHFNYSTRPIANRHFYFPVNIGPDSNAVIFYRIDMRGNGLHLPFLLVRKGLSQKNESGIGFFYVFFCGWLSFVVLFSMIAFFWLRNRLYLFYSLYVASSCFVFLGDGNFDVQWLYPHWPWLATISPSVYALLTYIFMLLFTNDFLQLKVVQYKLFRFVQLWVILLGVALVLLPSAYIFSSNISFRYFVFHYSFLIFICTSLLQIFSIAWRIKDKFKPAYLYGIAVGGVLLSSVVYALHVLNLMPDLVPTYIYLPIGFSFEIVVLSVALFYNYNFYKKQHHQLSLDIANQQLNFSKQLLQVQEAEQQRIAEDLHDELGGNLAAIKMKLQSIDVKSEDLDGIINLIDTASKNARNIAHNLMPPEFEETKLEELLQNFFNRINREGDIRFNFIVTGNDGHFDKQQSLIIYRILLELTNNIIKHSGATKATIQMLNYHDYLEILAEDNGDGFTNKSGDGIGLKNIRSRVGFLKGELNIDSGTTGTTIIIRIPYTQ